MEDETTFDRRTDEPLQVASLMTEDSKVRSVYWGCLAVILFMTLLIHIYRRRIANEPDANVRRLQKLARNELIVLREASMDVSAKLFPRPSFLASTAALLFREATALASADELQPLLQHIRSPPESKGSTHEQHLNRLCVLGSALWFRFQFHAGFSKLAISTLGEALRKDNQISSSDHGEESLGIGLPFMKETLLWALLPQHRGICDYCLDSLAWVFRNESTNSLEQSAIPMEVLTCMVDEIIQAYYLKGKSGPVQCDPELVPESPGDGGGVGNADLSTEPLLSSSSINNSTSSTGMNAQRLCGYLHLLNVLIPRNGGAEQNGSDGTDTSFQLRPGILEPIKSLPDSRTCTFWTRPFLTKLSLLIDSEMKPNATANDGEEAQPELTSFVLKVLPALMIELQSYSQAIQLLQEDQSFATSRRKQLGLTAAISAYVREWKTLEQCMRQGVLPAICIAKCQVFKTMCAETLSSCSKMIQSTPLATSEGGHEEIVSVCLELATFASNQKDDADAQTIAIRLLQKARHLQVLALEAMFRQVAKSIQNLAITLHVRAGIRNEKKKLVGTDPRIPSKECFDISSELLATISGICKDQKDLICELSLEELAIAMCQSLSKTWLELQPILDRAKAPIKIGESSLNGIHFRINRVVVQFEKSQTSAQIFASLQSKLSKLCPSEQKDQATHDLLTEKFVSQPVVQASA